MSQQVASLYAEIGAKTDGFEKGSQRVKAELRGLVPGIEGTKNSLAGFVSNNAALIGVLAGVGVALKKNFDEYNSYVDVVRDTARALGTTSEEASRLIQIADDVTISQQSMTTAFKLALKDGYEPSIDGLARMSDEYLKLAPGTERAQYLVDRFGKSGLEMGKLLDLGSAAIRRQADAVEDGLIITQKAMEQQRKYEISIDALGDSFQSLAFQAMPPVVDGLTWITNGLRDNNRAIELAEEAGYGLASSLYIIHAQFLETAAAERELADANLLAKKTGDDAAGSFETQAEKAKLAADAAEELSNEYAGMIGLIQSIQDAEEQYTEESLSLADDRWKAQARVNELQEQGFDVQSQEMQDALVDLHNVQQQEQDLADARDKQFLQFMSNILQEQLARDGWSTSEFEAFAAQQEVWGLWSAETVARAKEVWGEVDQITNSIRNIPVDTVVTITTQHIDTYGDGLIGPPDLRDQGGNTNTPPGVRPPPPDNSGNWIYANNQWVPWNPANWGGGGGGSNGLFPAPFPHSSGGSFMIPMSYGNEGFRMGNGDTASGGETVTISPRGGGQSQNFDYDRMAKSVAIAVRDSLLASGIGR